MNDLANLCVFLMKNYSGNQTVNQRTKGEQSQTSLNYAEQEGGKANESWVNAGIGKKLTIKALTELVAKVVGYKGEIK